MGKPWAGSKCFRVKVDASRSATLLGVRGGGIGTKSQPYLVGSRSSWASQKRNEVEEYGAAVAQYMYIRSRKLTAIIGLSGFNMSESSGFARVSKNGNRSVGNKPGIGAGVSRRSYTP